MSTTPGSWAEHVDDQNREWYEGASNPADEGPDDADYEADPFSWGADHAADIAEAMSERGASW